MSRSPASAFQAGSLWEWLSDRGIDVALRMANACGALVATAPGNSAQLLSGDGPRKLLEGESSGPKLLTR